MIAVARLVALAVVVALIWRGPALADGGVEVEEVAPGVFVTAGVHEIMSAANRGHIATASFVIGETGVAVIDTGGSVAFARDLRAAIAARTTAPVTHVIYTHVHPDHIFGAAAFLADAPIFVGHAKLPRAMAARAAFYLEANARVMGEAALEGVEIAPPTLTVPAGEERVIDLGGRRLALRAWPTAHTDADLTVFDEKTATLFSGDLVFLGHAPAIDGSILGWLKALDALGEIEAEHLVPGHGPPSTAWPEGAAATRSYLETLAADIRAMIAAGRPIGDAAAEAGLSQREAWKLFDEFNPRNATAAYTELEWE